MIFFIRKNVNKILKLHLKRKEEQVYRFYIPAIEKWYSYRLVIVGFILPTGTVQIDNIKDIL